MFLNVIMPVKESKYITHIFWSGEIESFYTSNIAFFLFIISENLCHFFF